MPGEIPHQFDISQLLPSNFEEHCSNLDEVIARQLADEKYSLTDAQHKKAMFEQIARDAIANTILVGMRDSSKREEVKASLAVDIKDVVERVVQENLNIEGDQYAKQVIKKTLELMMQNENLAKALKQHQPIENVGSQD